VAARILKTAQQGETTMTNIEHTSIEDTLPKRRKRAFYPHETLTAQVGMRIRALRNEQGIPLREFGKLAGVHPFHVMAVELGQASANIRTLAAIAKALGVTPADLLNRREDVREQIVELLRRNPEMVPGVLAKVKPMAELAMGNAAIGWFKAETARLIKPAKVGASQ
jgi:transcriptional regulator with XRE-family HTH domain